MREYGLVARTYTRTWLAVNAPPGKPVTSPPRYTSGPPLVIGSITVEGVSGTWEGAKPSISPSLGELLCVSTF
jgi:hypothetical protein